MYDTILYFLFIIAPWTNITCARLWRTLFYSFKGIRHSCGERDVYKCLAVDCYSIITRERYHIFGSKLRPQLSTWLSNQSTPITDHSIHSFLWRNSFFFSLRLFKPKHKYQRLDFLHPFIQSVNLLLLYFFFFIFIFHRNKRLPIVCVCVCVREFCDILIKSFANLWILQLNSGNWLSSKFCIKVNKRQTMYYTLMYISAYRKLENCN